MITRLARTAARLLLFCCGLAHIPGVDAVAQERADVRLLWGDDSAEGSGLPITLTSALAADSQVPAAQGINPEPIHFAHYQPSPNGQVMTGNPSFGNGSTFANNSGAGPSANSRSAKSGTGLDSLPSFRGIKGIKNLPGGVGTLLMANPHVGMTWYPEQGTDQPGTTLSMERAHFQAGIPVYHRGNDTFVLTSHMDVTNVYTNAILPTTKQTFPNQLFNIALGVNYFHPFENGNVGGVVFDMGSASDKPFESGREMLASGTGFLLMPQSDHDAWFVGVNASTNSQVLFGLPIPGGGYFYHPSEDFQAIVGFPFSVVSWKPARDWQLQYVWAFLTTMHARAVYQPTPLWQLYAGFDWTNENWRLAERVNEQNHFFYYEKKLATGLLWWFKPNVGLEVSGGWAFDRYFTEVHGFKLVGDNTVNIGSGPYLSSQIDFRF